MGDFDSEMHRAYLPLVVRAFLREPWRALAKDTFLLEAIPKATARVIWIALTAVFDNGRIRIRIFTTRWWERPSSDEVR